MTDQATETEIKPLVLSCKEFLRVIKTFRGVSKGEEDRLTPTNHHIVNSRIDINGEVDVVYDSLANVRDVTNIRVFGKINYDGYPFFSSKPYEVVAKRILKKSNVRFSGNQVTFPNPVPSNVKLYDAIQRVRTAQDRLDHIVGSEGDRLYGIAMEIVAKHV